MNAKVVLSGVAITLALLTGCGKRAERPASNAEAPKPTTVAVVKDVERSSSFLTVNRHLELGGTLYGYVDVDGDVQKLASGLKEILGQARAVQPQLAPFAEQDFVAIATTLGLADIKALGVSSVPEGDGYFRNRAFFHIPGERHGLLLGFGGEAKPFKHLNLAPADTAFYAEAEVDVPVVYRTVRDVVTKVAGEEIGKQMETTLKKAGEDAALSVLDLIHGLKGNSAMVLRVDPKQTIRTPGPAGISLPSFSLLVCVEGVAPVIEPALAKSPLFKRTDDGALRVYELTQASPLKELQPVLIADGTTLFFTTTRAFYDECRKLQSGLAQTPEFEKALAAVGKEGNGLTYIHPRLFEAFRQLEALNPQLPPQAKPVISMLLSKVPKTDRPIVALRTNLPDGILVRSYWHRSMKQEVAMVAMYNPVSIGLVAAMAIPAFQKVRTSSQEKAIMNNLRQLASAADQYYLEHGATTVRYDQLVGPEPSKYIKRIVPVAGEDYRQLRFVQGQPLKLRLRDGKVVTYGP